MDIKEKRDGKLTGESRGGAQDEGAGQDSRDARWENNGCARLAGTWQPAPL